MNLNTENKPDAALEYQTVRFQELLAGMVDCCDERMSYEARRLGLPTSEMSCLRLFDGEKYLTVKGIAHHLGVAKSRVSKILDGLQAKGLVDRRHDPLDARIKLISLTPAGEIKSNEIESILRLNHRRVLLMLTPEERKNALTVMETLRSAMEAVKEIPT